MIRRHSGRIINISSVWGIAGASCEAVYSAAKAGLIGFTKALGKELASAGSFCELDPAWVKIPKDLKRGEVPV